MSEGDDAGGDDDGNAGGDADEEAAGDADGPVRAWLVERDYDDKGLVTLVYATPDGRRRRRMEVAAASLGRRSVTAAVAADPGDLDPTPDDRVERYRTEAERMRERHDPDEEV